MESGKAMTLLWFNDVVVSRGMFFETVSEVVAYLQ